MQDHIEMRTGVESQWERAGSEAFHRGSERARIQIHTASYKRTTLL